MDPAMQSLILQRLQQAKQGMAPGPDAGGPQLGGVPMAGAGLPPQNPQFALPDQVKGFGPLPPDLKNQAGMQMQDMAGPDLPVDPQKEMLKQVMFKRMQDLYNQNDPDKDEGAPPSGMYSPR